MRIRILFPILFCLLFCLRFAVPTTALAVWPVEDPPQVALGFNEVYVSGGSQILHHGVDISAGAGDVILAPQPGTISFVGAVPASDTTEGQTMQAVSLTLADGRILTLMPFAQVDVEYGASVEAGNGMGTLATTGDRSVSVTHIHVGLKRGGVYYDPLELLGPQESLSLDGRLCGEQQVIAGESLSRESVGPEPLASAVFGSASGQTVAIEESVQILGVEDLASSAENLISGEENLISNSGGLVSSGGARLDSKPEPVPVPDESRGAQSINVMKSLVIDIEALISETSGIGSIREVTALVLGVSGVAFGCLGLALIGNRARSASRVKGMNTERRGSADKDKLALVADR